MQFGFILAVVASLAASVHASNRFNQHMGQLKAQEANPKSVVMRDVEHGGSCTIGQVKCSSRKNVKLACSHQELWEVDLSCGNGSCNCGGGGSVEK